MSKGSNKSLVVKLVLVSVSTFVFGVFAMPPLYDKFCQITGIGQQGVRVETAAELPEATDRQVTLLLDSTANSSLPWEFEPLERRITVQVGEASQTAYRVRNLLDEANAGRAVYNVTPPVAARYFVKTECFCFSRQSLMANEEKEMPVRFYIDPELPAEIEEITLSYTFFPNPDKGAAGSAAAAAGSD